MDKVLVSLPPGLLEKIRAAYSPYSGLSQSELVRSIVIAWSIEHQVQ